MEKGSSQLKDYEKRPHAERHNWSVKMMIMMIKISLTVGEQGNLFRKYHNN